MIHDLQGTIYRLESGRGARMIRLALALLVFCGLAVYYDTHFGVNFRGEEAMDSAQVARNLAEGRGFSTRYVRPFSLYLLARQGAGAKTLQEAAHPDLANAPAYPLFLAGLMKVLPIHKEIDPTGGKNFQIYQPEAWIGAANQVLFLVALILVFQLAVKLFDEPTAWVASVAFAGSEIYWRLSASGVASMLLVVISLLLFWVLAALDGELRSETPRLSRVWGLAAGLGGLAAVGALTRYSFGWIMIPVALYLAVYGGKSRAGLVAVPGVVFLLVLSPWMARNHALCGNPFGVAGYAAAELTSGVFPGDKLARSSNPTSGLGQLGARDYQGKLASNAHDILQRKMPTLGANWIFMMFLAGLLIPFHNRRLQRLRYFLLVVIPVFLVAEALGKTHLSLEAGDVSSENLLVLAAPATFIFGASFLCTLLEHLNMAPPLRAVMVAGFAAAAALPFLVGLLVDHGSAVAYRAYPPYYPPAIRAICGWMKPGEAVMSDIPWAVAWYGDTEGVGLALDAKPEFERVSSERGNVKAVLLSAKFLGESFRSLVGGQNGWGGLALSVIATGKTPPGFPLAAVLPDLLPDEVVVSDSPRWAAGR